MMGVEDEVPEAAVDVTRVCGFHIPNEIAKNGLEHKLSDNVHIRGGECTNSSLVENHEVHNSLACVSEDKLEEVDAWNGWAEIENDPEIFTILLQEWGASHVTVEEVLDVSELPTNSPDRIIGLIFLSRYVAPDTTQSSSQNPGDDDTTSSPWFANQISKFSCGTVSLMNILMNSKDYELSETLSMFKEETKNLSAKDRGIYLDGYDKFRNTHNSFSTLLDRMIVDQILKEEFQAATRRSTAVKRKKGRKGRRRKATNTDADENGNHFVAYISTGTTVWRLDGMQANPEKVGDVVEGLSWLDVASAALLQQIEGAIRASYEVSLMKVVRSEAVLLRGEAAELEKHRKKEDWAPFIEHMIRLHAERGDLAELLDM